MMRRELAAVYDELLRRQREGEQSVFLSEDALRVLRAAAATPAPERAPGAARRPPPERAPEEPQARPPGAAQPSAAAVPGPPQVLLPDGSKAERREALRQIVLADPWCRSQVKPGKQVVFGVGALDARIFLCGEAPGADEEVQGEPFVGPAGQLLTRIIQTAGLTREEVYIANIMNYRPPLPGPVGNRPPSAAEMAYCLPYLLAQLDIVRPGVIVALGKTAVDGLLGPDPKRRMAQIRGRWTEFNGIPLLPTYHPSYLLRNQGLQAKRQVWEDMLAVLDFLKLPVTAKQRGYFLKQG